MKSSKIKNKRTWFAINKDVKLGIVAFLLFTAAGIFITYPLVFHMGEYITGYGDELSYAWIYNWAIHSLLSGDIFNLYNTNIFYPYQIALSNSDPNLTSSFMAIIPQLLLKEPIVAVNYTILSSIILVGFSLYVLTYYLTRDFFVSLFAGILVIFSPSYLSFYVHIQMMAVEFIPFAILFFLIFIKTYKTKYLLLSLFFFVLQTYNNFIAGYFILFSYLILLIFHCVQHKVAMSKLITKKNILYVIISLLIIIPIMLPYYAVSKEFNYVRDIRDTIHFALQPEDLLYSSPFSKLHTFLNDLPINEISQNDEFKPGFPGITFLLLTVVVIFTTFWKIKKYFKDLGGFVIIAVTGLMLSLGPVLHLGRQTIHEPFMIPLPYALFYYVLPGFQGFRNSARWEMLFLLAMAIAIAIFLHKIVMNYRLRTRIILYSLLIFSCIAEYNFPMQFHTVPPITNFPPVVKWIAATPKDSVIMEMPLYNWNMTPYSTIEFWRMYYSTTHFRRTVNGGGGFTPPPWEKFAFEIDSAFPSQKSITMIQQMKVDYLIVHANEFDRLHNDKYKINGKVNISGNDTIDQLKQNKSLKLIKQFNDVYVFEISHSK